MVLGLDRAADVGELAVEEQDAGKTEGKDELEELGKLVDAVGAAEEVGVLSQRQRRGGDGGQRNAEGDGPGEFLRRGAEGDHEEAERAGEQHQLRKEGMDEKEH